MKGYQEVHRVKGKLGTRQEPRALSESGRTEVRGKETVSCLEWPDQNPITGCAPFKEPMPTTKTKNKGALVHSCSTEYRKNSCRQSY